MFEIVLRFWISAVATRDLSMTSENLKAEDKTGNAATARPKKLENFILKRPISPAVCQRNEYSPGFEMPVRKRIITGNSGTVLSLNPYTPITPFI